MQVTPNNPKTTPRQFAICAPIGTENVRLDGVEVVGAWKSPLIEFYGLPRNRLLVEDFVNWSSEPSDIVRFTALYAPLGEKVLQRSSPMPGKEFRFTLDLWRRAQSFVQETWMFSAATEHHRFRLSGVDEIEIGSGKLTYRAGNLLAFMNMELLLSPLDRLRYCGNPECPSPYFVAAHMKQRYCSPACAEWAQAEWKKKWWKEKGPAWLKASRKRETSSRKKGHSDRRYKR